MTGARIKVEGVPELCEHFDPAECTEACHEKARVFDAWLRGELLKEGNGNAHFDQTHGRDRDDR